MSADEIHLEDIGTVFEVTVQDGTSAVDISSATTKNMIFRKPDGSTVTKTASFVTDGTDGKLKYTTVEDDLDMEGSWELQIYLVMTGFTGRSDIGTFYVYANL